MCSLRKNAQTIFIVVLVFITLSLISLALFKFVTSDKEIGAEIKSVSYLEDLYLNETIAKHAIKEIFDQTIEGLKNKISKGAINEVDKKIFEEEFKNHLEKAKLTNESYLFEELEAINNLIVKGNLSSALVIKNNTIVMKIKMKYHEKKGPLEIDYRPTWIFEGSI